MANFFDGITGEAITALEVKKGSKFKLGLYGGGPAPKYERLNVTTATVPGPNPKLNEKDPAVTFVKEIAKGSSMFLYEINSARMQGPVVRACYNGDDYSEAVDVVFEDVDDIRTRGLRGIVWVKNADFEPSRRPLPRVRPQLRPARMA